MPQRCLSHRSSVPHSIAIPGTPAANGCQTSAQRFFEQISRSKGQNITFIADCCYSHSLTRPGLGGSGIRSVHPTSNASIDNMLHAAYEWLSHYGSLLSEDWRPDMSFLTYVWRRVWITRLQRRWKERMDSVGFYHNTCLCSEAG